MAKRSDDLHIYVVDDNDSARSSLCALLNAHGFITTEASSGNDLFEKLNADFPACIILDIRMPSLSGIEIQNKLKEQGFRLPIIMLTGHGDVPIAVEAMKAGAIDFIEKPASQSQLLAALESARDFIANRPIKVTPSHIVQSRLDRLTKREREVLNQLILGKTNKQIADDLSISRRTVEIHRSRVREKMEAQSLAELIRMLR